MKTLVLKTGDEQSSVGSNPTPNAKWGIRIMVICLTVYQKTGVQFSYIPPMVEMMEMVNMQDCESCAVIACEFKSRFLPQKMPI